MSAVVDCGCGVLFMSAVDECCSVGDCCWCGAVIYIIYIKV